MGVLIGLVGVLACNTDDGDGDVDNDGVCLMGVLTGLVLTCGADVDNGEGFNDGVGLIGVLTGLVRVLFCDTCTDVASRDTVDMRGIVANGSSIDGTAVVIRYCAVDVVVSQNLILHKMQTSYRHK
jgi:hypothetical protein